MESSSSSSISSSSAEPLLQRLTSKGWCFRDADQVKSLLSSPHSFALDGEVELELCNLDLCSVGGKALPDASSIARKSFQLRVPVVLQVVSAKDVSKSSFSNNASNRRLLKMRLTDGHSEITAIEFSYIPSLPDDIIPGTKIRLERKPTIRDGIVCLCSGVVSVLGGTVQSLYEEWQMNKKYSGFTRSSLRPVREGDTGGPPPFKKLKVGAAKARSVDSASCNSGSRVVESIGASRNKPMDQQDPHSVGSDSTKNDPVATSASERREEKPSSSEARPKEVAECAPVQNKEAAQKLLQKLNHPTHKSQYQRGQRFNRGKEEEKPVFTLDEWERSRGKGVSIRGEHPDVSVDEDLAWQLQNQFDLEDQVQRNPRSGGAEDLKMSMFSFDRSADDGGYHGRTGSRGGRGRRGRGSGRGRGRGRG